MIKQNIGKLPPLLQKAITSTEVEHTLRTLSQKYRLHIDQGQILENETYMVLLGIEQAKTYEENLKNELGITPQVAKDIAQDVAKEIFLSIRNLLKESTTPESEPQKEASQELKEAVVTAAPPPKATTGALRSDAQSTGALHPNSQSTGALRSDAPVLQEKPKEKNSEEPGKTLGETLTTKVAHPVAPSSDVVPSKEPVSKLDSVVKNQRKDIEFTQAKPYSVDPYREPID